MANRIDTEVLIVGEPPGERCNRLSASTMEEFRLSMVRAVRDAGLCPSTTMTSFFVVCPLGDSR
jgi:hypothetical protein